MATIARHRSGKRVLEAATSLIAPPAEQDVAIADWLAAERRKSGSIGSVLDSDDYQLMLVEAPDVLPAELKAAVRWRLKDVVEFPLDDAIVDVFPIPDQVRRTGAKMLYAVAAKRAAVDRHVSLIKPENRRFDVIDIPELALRNLAAVLPQANDGLVFLWLRRNSAQLLVVKGLRLYLTRFVAFPHGSRADPDVPGAEIDALALEMQRSMDYFESHYEQAPLAHLVIAPWGPYSAALTEELAAHTSMRVGLLDLDPVLELPADVRLNDARTLIAIGGALREEGHAA
jgi:MSHA biogenesis protein MshI